MWGWNGVEGVKWGAGRCGGGGGALGGVAPWLARGPPKAGLAASVLYYYNLYLTDC